METEGEFVFAASLDTKDMDQIAEFLEQSVKGEGARFPPHPAAPGRCLPAICRTPSSVLHNSPRILSLLRLW